MAKNLSLSGIQTGQAIEAKHVTQSIEAFTGAEAYDITVSGSLTVQGPVQGTAGTLNNFSSSYALTASYALNGGSGGGGGGSVGTLQQVMESGSITTLVITASVGISSSGAIISPSFTGSLSGSALEAISASFAQTASYVLNAVSASFSQTASYVLNAISSSYALTASHALDAEGFPFSGSAVITGSLVISSSNQDQTLQLYGSGSTIFSIEGSRGTLFSIDDDESDGKLFSVNNVSGTPVLEVHEDNTVKLGKQNGFGIVISGSNPLPNDADAKILITGSIHHSGSSVNFNSFVSASSFNAPPGVINQLTASYAISASVEVTKEISSSYADTASYVLASNIDQPFTDIIASGNISASGYISASNLDISGSATIDGTLTLTQTNNSNPLIINNGTGTEIYFPGTTETNITSEGLFIFNTSNNQGYGFGVNGDNFKAVIGDPGLATTATTVIADTYNGRLILRGNANPNQITGSIEITGSALTTTSDLIKVTDGDINVVNGSITSSTAQIGNLTIQTGFPGGNTMFRTTNGVGFTFNHDVVSQPAGKNLGNSSRAWNNLFQGANVSDYLVDVANGIKFDFVPSVVNYYLWDGSPTRDDGTSENAPPIYSINPGQEEPTSYRGYFGIIQPSGSNDHLSTNTANKFGLFVVGQGGRTILGRKDYNRTNDSIPVDKMFTIYDGQTSTRELFSIETGSGATRISGSVTITDNVDIVSSGSDILNIQGSQGQLFNVDDDLLHNLFLVTDISGEPLFKVSGSGLVEVLEGSITTPQGTINELTASHAMNIQPKNNFMPVVTHTTNFNSTSSYAGYYNIVGGTLSITVTTGSSPTDLTPGMEWNFFQTSSGNNFTFTVGTGVTVISRNNNKRLSQLGSTALLKYISGQTFHLVGDLTI